MLETAIVILQFTTFIHRLMNPIGHSCDFNSLVLNVQIISAGYSLNGKHTLGLDAVSSPS